MPAFEPGGGQFGIGQRPVLRSVRGGTAQVEQEAAIPALHPALCEVAVADERKVARVGEHVGGPRLQGGQRLGRRGRQFGTTGRVVMTFKRQGDEMIHVSNCSD